MTEERMRWINGLMVGLLLVFCVGSIMVPQRMTRPEAAVPAWAVYLVEQQVPFSGWPSSLEQPLVRAQLISTGLTDEQLAELQAGALRRILSRLPTVDQGVFARVQGRDHGRFFWIYSGSAGPHAAAFRLGLQLFRPASVRSVGLHAGHQIWEWEPDCFPEQLRCGFAVADGLLLAVLSRDLNDMTLLLDALDGRVPSRAGRLTGRD